ncbi:MAG: DUF3592 domain-containing protein [Clostridium sp.]|uniref:DUF3592 domain-containing protein n=1 Tax=Clostridium sp. TaxID=1506 RepID=UPI0025BBD0C3|nr:DUF3592 domain-containing protein [Clostridium sp.]MCF0147377.1 DUF3592 domain-containing protein [Clostridium sp.]
MKINILLFLIFFIDGLALSGLSLFLKNRDKNTLERSTEIVMGRVVKYSLLGKSGVYFPILEYIVNEVAYYQRLKYSWIITKSSSFKIITPDIENNYLDTKLVIIKNSHFSRNVLVDKFPIGTELPVYYNPSNPKESYVLRFSKNPVTNIFLAVGILFIILSFMILVFLPNS